MHKDVPVWGDPTHLYEPLQEDGRGWGPFLQVSTAMFVFNTGATKPLYRSVNMVPLY